jgi:hypothetical protein
MVKNRLIDLIISDSEVALTQKKWIVRGRRFTKKIQYRSTRKLVTINRLTESS